MIKPIDIYDKSLYSLSFFQPLSCPLPDYSLVLNKRAQSFSNSRVKNFKKPLTIYKMLSYYVVSVHSLFLCLNVYLEKTIFYYSSVTPLHIFKDEPSGKYIHKTYYYKNCFLCIK